MLIQKSICPDSIAAYTDVGQIVARPAIEPHPFAILARDDAEAIVLDFMKPERPRWRVRGCHWQTRHDEPAGTAANDERG